jgi:glutathione synthase/RimK-type ligase-like ATP-grasp enzyme
VHDPSPTDVLVATTVHWASTTRLALALAEAGLRVAAVAPAEHALHRMDALTLARTCVPHSGFVSAVAEAITALRPAMVVPGDDRAVRGLHALYERVERGGTAGRNVAETIRRSLGEPSSFAIVDLKSRFATFCKREGFPLPETVAVRNRSEFLQQLDADGLPQVLKLDIGSGGRCVRIVRSASEASAAYDELAAMQGWCSAIRRSLEELSTAPLVDKLRGRAPTISSQRYIAGWLANRAMYCRNGRVLAGITVVTMQVLKETGPTTVARVLDHPEVEDLAARIVRKLKLSGFIGIDVVLEEVTSRPWLLELNPRPTQTCHLALGDDLDMVGAIARELRGATRRAVPRAANPYGRIIAFYPGELWRDPSSEYLRAPYHDVPLHEPKFIAAYARPVPDEPLSWVQSLVRRQPLRAVRRKLATVEVTDAVEGRAIGLPSSETTGITWLQHF